MRTERTNRGDVASSVGVLVAVLLCAASVQAATWVGGTEIWDDSDTTNWSGGAIPGTGDAVALTQSSATDIDVTYAATSQTGTELVVGNRYGGFTLNNSGVGTTTLLVGTGDLLPTGSTTLGVGGKLDVSGGTFTPDTHMYVRGGDIVQTGGLIQPLWYDLSMSSGTLSISGGETNVRQINVGRELYGAPYGTANITVSGSGILRIRSTNTIIGADDPASAATVTLAGGSIIAASQFHVVGANAMLDLQSGSLSAAQLYQAGGTVDHGNITSTFVYERMIGSAVGASAVFNLSAGSTSGRGLLVGAHWPGYNQPDPRGAGTVNHTGGTMTINDLGNSAVPGLQIGHDSSAEVNTYNLRGGTLSGSATLRVLGGGVLQGYGAVPLGLFRQVYMNGRVVADGDGVEQDLDLSSYTGFNNGTQNEIQNTVENTATNGWYASDKGRLLLPTVGRTLGGAYYVKDTTGSTYNWGETAGDAQLDLVNSTQFTFTNLGTGNGILTGSLLATDRSDVPTFVVPGMTKQGLFSVHEFSLAANTFDSYDLTIRYDDTAAGEFEDVLQLFHYTGGAWVDVTSALDTANNLVSATGLTSFSMFGVGYAVPEPASGLLMLLGVVVLARRRR